MDKKWIISLFVIVIVAFIIRGLNSDKTIVFDEYVQTNAVINHNPAGLDKGTEIPPLTTWTRIAFTSIFGISTVALKFASIFFGIATILLVFLLAKELYNEEVGIIASVIVAVSSWHILGSTSISFDGAFLTFYYLLTIYFFIRYTHSVESKNANSNNAYANKWLILTGVGFGLAMLTKLNAILLLPILFLYYIYENNIISNKKLNNKFNYIKFIKVFAIIIIVSIAIFLVFPLAAILTDWSYFQVVMGHTNVFNNASFNFSLLAIQFMLAIFWAGPLLLFSYALSFFYYEKKDFVLHSFIIVVFLFFSLVVQENFRPVERYFIILIPAFAILGAKSIHTAINNAYSAKKNNARYNTYNKYNIDTKNNINAKYNSNSKYNNIEQNNKKNKIKIFFVLFSIIFLIYSGILLMLSQNNNILPFYPKIAFIDNVLHFNWNFLVPFTGDQGPIGMYVPFSVIAISFILTMILALGFLWKKNLALFVIFLAVAVSFNFYMAEELIFGKINYDIDKVNKDIIMYAETNKLNEPVYVFRNYALKYYLQGQNYDDIRIIDFEDLDGIELEKGSTVIIIDFPSVGKQNKIWDTLGKNCILGKDFSDRNKNLGYIYNC